MYWQNVMAAIFLVKEITRETKEGKKRMKAVGNVEIPQEAFMAILSVDDE